MISSIVLIGSPGSGKDTQTSLLAKKLPVVPIKTGELIRNLAKTNDSVALSLKKGEFANNDIVNDLIGSQIDKLSSDQAFVSDAYPRDLTQALWFDKYLAETSRRVELVIYLEVSETEVIKRMKKRKREDENIDIIKKRLADFRGITSKVINYYKKKNLLITINGEGDIEEINRKIVRAILEK